MTEATRVFRLTVAYDGGRFKGWQRGNGRTVQGTLESAVADALPAVSGGRVRPGLWKAAAGAAEADFVAGRVQVDGAGRTDAGVHAAAQVASVRLPASVRPERLLAAVNDRLPDDVQLLACVPVDDRFHARYRARGKTYLYRVVDGPVGDPFLAGYAWRVRGDLDVGLMRSAAAALVGEHDFAALTADKSKKSKVKTVGAVAVDRAAPGRIDIRVTGDGFLWNQVRIMAALLVLAGQGKADAATIAGLVAAGERAAAPAPAPACGLCLEKVEYADS
jgi:tRNA pseudouridine38-40 synthase